MATGLCDDIPRLFVGRLIAIAASPLMQHGRAYRGCDASASPDERALKNLLFRLTGALEDTDAPDDDD